MFKTKNMFAVPALVFAVCICVAVAGCGEKEQQHTHTFSEDWMRSSTEHWHEATCEHTDEKSDLGAHEDLDNDGLCDICDYNMKPSEEHTHTFADTWSYDGKTHWHAATCNDTTERQDEAPHVDEDGDQFCDLCTGLIDHEHKFSETEWEFDINKHWRPATCGHPTERGNEEKHTFTNGVCECGVKEDEITAYNALIEYKIISEEDYPEFASWLAEIKDDGVTDVRVTEMGDILYDRDGEIEAKYVTRRQISVSAATTTGEPVADVWYKISVSVDGEYRLFANGTTDALAVAKTADNGVAELSFTPSNGYSSDSVVYSVRLAEAKDLAATLGQDETSYHPIPNRYALHSTKNSIDYQVCEDYDVLENVGSIVFDFSKAWNAGEKTVLPYARWYANPLNGTGLDYDGLEYTLTTSGNGFYDYLYFIPSQKFSFSGYESESSDNKATIEANYKKAASGEYQISFEVQGGENANVTLVFWNEGGVEFDSYYLPKADGTPDDMYVSSISGRKPAGSEVAGSKFTSENYVNVTVSVSQGLRAYQLGLLSDEECTVTLKVKRIKDYEEDTTVKELTEGNNGNFALGGNGAVTKFRLRDVSSGYHTLTLTADGVMQAGYIFAWFIESQPYYLWSNGKYESLVEVPAGAEYLYIQNNRSLGYSMNITLTKYEREPTLNLGEVNWLPVSGANGKPMTVKIDKSSLIEGNNIYVADIMIDGARLQQYEVSYDNVKKTSITMELGGESTTIPIFSGAPSVTCFLDISKGDEVVFESDHPEFALFMVRVTFIPLGVLDELNKWYDYNDFFIYDNAQHVGKCYVKEQDTMTSALPFVFRATQSGTYKITIARNFTGGGDPFLFTSEDISPSHKSTNLLVKEDDGSYTYTFRLDAGESVIFIMPLVQWVDYPADLCDNLIKVESIN